MHSVEQPFNDDSLLSTFETLEHASPQEILSWALDTFGRRMAIATSFQLDGMAILDMAWKIEPSVRVISVDSGRLFQETYDVIDIVRERYRIPIEIYAPNSVELDEFVLREGVNPFYRSVGLRERCCEIRKVNPIKKVLGTLDAWVTGVRRDQAWTRTGARAVEMDERYDRLVKINPLVNWTEAQVWEYVRSHDVPTNALYGQGYSSIGCQPCTRRVEPGDDLRSGRWWWERDEHKECGIHGRRGSRTLS